MVSAEPVEVATMGDTQRTALEVLIDEFRREVARTAELVEERDSACSAERETLSKRIGALEADKAERDQAARDAEVAANAVAGAEALRAAKIARWKSRGFAVAKGAGIIGLGLFGSQFPRMSAILLKLLGVGE